MLLIAGGTISPVAAMPQLPGLAFEPNVGQADPEFAYLGRGHGIAVSIRPTELRIAVTNVEPPDDTALRAIPGVPRSRWLLDRLTRPKVSSSIVTLSFPGANARARVTGLERMPGIVNSYVGADPAAWRKGIPRYAKVRVEQIYPGIDLELRNTDEDIEYDFIVARDADPSAIEIAIAGVESLRLTSNGALEWRSAAGHARQHKPWIYQQNGDRKETIDGGYVAKGGGRFAFRVGAYDRSRPLVIDPVLSFYTKLTRGGRGVAVDSAGNIYVGGLAGGYGAGFLDVLITKLTPKGVLSSTTIFGGSGHDYVNDIAIDDSGFVSIAGVTEPLEIPDMPLQQCLGTCRGAFLARLDPDLALVAVTVLGGDSPSAVAVDAEGNSVIVGYVTTLKPDGRPCLGFYEGCWDARVAKFDPQANLIYVREFGGTKDDLAFGVAMDAAGHAYVTGETRSTDFNPAPFSPTPSPPFQSVLKGLSDAFVIKLGPTGSYLYSTLVGGSGFDRGWAVAVNDAGEAIVSGGTAGDFPIVGQIPDAAGTYAYGSAVIFRLAADASSLKFSTKIGGNTGAANLIALKRDDAGNIHSGGEGYLSDFFSFKPVGAWLPGDDWEDAQAVALKLSPEDLPLYSGYIGQETRTGVSAIAMDPDGNAVITGWRNEVIRDPGVPKQFDSFVTKIVAAAPEVAILPKTTRWRPRRDIGPDAKAMDIVFKGPSDLHTAELEVKGPSPVPEGQTALPSDYKPVLKAPFDPAKPVKDAQGDYKLTWEGPWTIPGPGGKPVPLPRGDYTLTLKGTKKDNAEEIASEPYRDMSLVDVTAIGICRTGGEADVCDPLDKNPRVPRHTEEPEANRVARPGGGWRVFAEEPSDGAGLDDEVKVLVTTSPVVPEDVRVFFRLIDVDDPDGTPIDKDEDKVNPACVEARNCVNDNYDTGSMRSSVTVLAKKHSVSTTLRLSNYPGDNYRVAASTWKPWLDDIRAHQPSETGEVLDKNDKLVPEGENLSKMVTVWRTLNLEIDSMEDPPSDPAHVERNFITGRITRLEGREDHIFRIFVAPESPPGMDRLRDDSTDLSERPPGKGRFELGTLRVGSGDAATVVQDVEGNGVDYVEGDIFVPYALVDAFGAILSVGIVVSGDPGPPSGEGLGTFTLNPVTGSWADAQTRAAALAIGGVRWPVLNVDATRITPNNTVIGRVLVRSNVFPFSLRDDDVRRKGPFEIDATLIQDTDSPETNAFAAAYIRPRRISVANRNRAPFKRNVECPPTGIDGCDPRETIESVKAGRDTTASFDFTYWVSYLQGAYQGGVKVDRDPNAETDILVGATVGGTGLFGSNIYVEALDDDLFDPDARLCREVVVPHELGHQFAILEDDPRKLGIMNESCNQGGRFFDAKDLKTIRANGVTPDFGGMP